MDRDKIREQLRRDEGLRLKPYTDSLGNLTIGFGRNLEARGISTKEAYVLLDNDIENFNIDLLIKLPWSADLDEPRYGVLLNMAFNMGISGLMTFKKTLIYVEQGQYDLAAAEMLDSRWAVEVGDRALRLSKQMETGVWQ
jgi:lysozyme